VPYDPGAIDPNADYVARGSIWDGSTLWTTATGVPVITKDNARSNVILTVTAVPVATPTPTAAPTPAPSPAVDPQPADNGGGTLPILLILGLAVIGGVVAAVVYRNRKQA
jgi:carbohydrate-binding DOMON domain-containing protein